MTNKEIIAHLEAFAAAKMAEHLPADELWAFTWIKTKRTLGICDYRLRTVSASSVYIGIATVEQLENTILHEISHAIAGYSAGHGLAWQSACVRIGAEPERLFDASSISPPYTWTMNCPSCDGPQRQLFSKPRSRRRESCGHCSGGKFNNDYLLTPKKLEPAARK